jgi:hypothetical protein
VLVGTGGGQLVLLQVGEGALVQAASVELGAEMSCVDISPLAEGATAAEVAAVGTWDMRLLLLRLPDLQQVGGRATGAAGCAGRGPQGCCAARCLALG